MSLVHLRLRRIRLADDAVEYAVESPDFNGSRPEDDWQLVGVLTIDIVRSDYDFRSEGPWCDIAVLPPKYWALSSDERACAIRTRFSGHSFGAWTGCIHDWASRLLARRHYPATYPP